MKFDTDVLIVGGGPVGIGLAIELGQRGIKCVVVERYSTPQQVPKGQNLSQRTMEHFQFWGIEEELRKARTIPPEYGIGGLTTYRTLLSDYAYDWLKREVVRPYYFADNERLPQYATEEVLRNRVSQLDSVETLYGWSADTVVQGGDGIEATISEHNGNGKRQISARYVVGCDGARSLVREQAGITQTRNDHDKLMVLLVFRSTALHELLRRYPGKSFYNVLHPELEGYWRFFGRVDLGSTWFFHAPVPMNTTKDNFDFKSYLHRSVGAEFDVEIEYIGFWDLRFATADQYRNGRIFIAGDAAHSHPPYGAFGVNTGFEDARNLGWKLSAVLDGWAEENILQTYDEERRPVFESTAKDFIESVIEKDRKFLDEFSPENDKDAFEHEWQKRASGTGGEMNSYEPNYRGSSIVFGPANAQCNAIGPHSFTARAGHHLAPQMLSSGRDVYDELGEGFTLLALDADAKDIDAFQLAADKLRVPLKIILDRQTSDTEKYEAKWILIRPDQFVAWAGDEVVNDPLEIIAKAVGILSALE